MLEVLRGHGGALRIGCESRGAGGFELSHHSDEGSRDPGFFFRGLYIASTKHVFEKEESGETGEGIGLVGTDLGNHRRADNQQRL